MTRTLLALAATAALSACATSTPTGSELAEALESSGGCGDLVVYAVDADKTLLLDVQADGLVQAATEAGEPTTTTFDLATATGVRVILEQGSEIDDAICDDVIENDGPIVDRSWTATAGTLEVTVRPGPTDTASDPRSDVTLTDVVLTPDGRGETLSLPSMTWTDIPVGWFAG